MHTILGAPAAALLRLQRAQDGRGHRRRRRGLDHSRARHRHHLFGCGGAGRDSDTEGTAVVTGGAVGGRAGRARGSKKVVSAPTRVSPRRGRAELAPCGRWRLSLSL
jgi:hypothetical protein